jgi:hypothetical protein
MNQGFSGQGVTISDVTNSIIKTKFFCDYGIVKAYKDGRVDVTMAIKRNDVDDVIFGVELMFLTGSGVSFEWDIKAGDLVMLFGMRHFIETVSELKTARKSETNFFYSSETVKAVPLAPVNKKSDFSVSFKENKYTLKNKDEKVFIDTVGDKIVLGTGSTEKELVTWGALNTALSGLVTSINTALAARQPGTSVSSLSLNIDSAKTIKTVVKE